MPDVAYTTAALSESDAEKFAAHVAELSSAGLPLAPGLRAAGAECRGRLGRALIKTADELDRGSSLEEALASRRTRLPSHVRGLMLASARTGDMGAVLGDLLEQRRQSRALRHSIFSALWYPICVLVLSILIFALFQAFVIRPILSSLVMEMDLNVPAHVKQTMWWGERGVWFLLTLLAAVPAIVIVVRLAIGAVRWRRLLSSAPLFGPLWHWTGVAEMTRLLAVLVERELPLAEALPLAGNGTSDANVRQACVEMTEGAAAGRRLSELMEASPRLPAALVPLVAWGERSGELPAALRSVSDHFAGRVRMRSLLLRTILPPFAFLTIGALWLSFINAVVAPLILLINGIS